MCLRLRSFVKGRILPLTTGSSSSLLALFLCHSHGWVGSIGAISKNRSYVCDAQWQRVGRIRRDDQGCGLELTTWGIGRESDRDDFMRDEMRWQGKYKEKKRVERLVSFIYVTNDIE